MEEDIDLRELIKAIQKGEKERAERIAITLFKRSPSNPAPKKNPNEWLPTVLCILSIAGIVVLSIIETWFTHKEKKKKEVMEVV